jgi:hypothetical protein
MAVLYSCFNLLRWLPPPPSYATCVRKLYSGYCSAFCRRAVSTQNFGSRIPDSDSALSFYLIVKWSNWHCIIYLFKKTPKFRDLHGCFLSIYLCIRGNYVELYWIILNTCFFYPTAFFVFSDMLVFENFFMFMGTGQTVSATFRYNITTIITADARTLTACSRLKWRPRRFKWTRPFRRKTKSGFCACAITFQTQSTILSWYSPIFVKASYCLEDFVCLYCFNH